MNLIFKYILPWVLGIMVVVALACNRFGAAEGSENMTDSLHRLHGDNKIDDFEYSKLSQVALQAVSKKYPDDDYELVTRRGLWEEVQFKNYCYKAKVCRTNAQGQTLFIYRVLLTCEGVADSCDMAITF